MSNASSVTTRLCPFQQTNAANLVKLTFIYIEYIIMAVLLEVLYQSTLVITC